MQLGQRDSAKIIISFILFVTLCIGRVSCYELNLNESLIEYLYPALIKNNNSMVLNLRKNAGYNTANEIIAIETFILKLQKFNEIDFNKELLEQGYSTEIVVQDNLQLTINDWIIIERLILSNDSVRLMEIAAKFTNSNDILKPVRIEKIKNSNSLKSYNLSLHNEYYLSTQFKFIKWIVNNNIYKSIANVDLIDNGSILYVWKKIKSLNIKVSQELFDDLYEEEYLEHYVLSSLLYDKKVLGLIETENIISEDSFLNPCTLYLNIEKMSELVKTQNMIDKWSECDCKEDYISFYMLKLLVGMHKRSNDISLENLESIKCMDNLFDLYLSTAQISKFTDIDNSIKSIYFSINFNNLENQGEFMIEYFNKYAKDGHIYSDLISKSIKEILSYSK
tara:strand:+ start:2236 stop:3414 length:1179 start_codon:yes stop_codon:yes gene_type:complete